MPRRAKKVNVPITADAKCPGPGCTREIVKAGLCVIHHNQQLRGAPLTTVPDEAAVAPVKGQRTSLGEDTVRRILKAYEAGVTITDITKRFRVSRGIVTQVLRAAGH